MVGAVVVVVADARNENEEEVREGGERLLLFLSLSLYASLVVPLSCTKRNSSKPNESDALLLVAVVGVLVERARGDLERERERLGDLLRERERERLRRVV